MTADGFIALDNKSKNFATRINLKKIFAGRNFKNL